MLRETALRDQRGRDEPVVDASPAKRCGGAERARMGREEALRSGCAEPVIDASEWLRGANRDRMGREEALRDWGRCAKPQVDPSERLPVVDASGRLGGANRDRMGREEALRDWGRCAKPQVDPSERLPVVDASGRLGGANRDRMGREEALCDWRRCAKPQVDPSERLCAVEPDADASQLGPAWSAMTATPHARALTNHMVYTAGSDPVTRTVCLAVCHAHAAHVHVLYYIRTFHAMYMCYTVLQSTFHVQLLHVLYYIPVYMH